MMKRIKCQQTGSMGGNSFVLPLSMYRHVLFAETFGKIRTELAATLTTQKAGVCYFPFKYIYR